MFDWKYFTECSIIVRLIATKAGFSFKSYCEESKSSPYGKSYRGRKSYRVSFQTKYFQNISLLILLIVIVSQFQTSSYKSPSHSLYILYLSNVLQNIYFTAP